jgi:hypothetical protein
MQLGTNVTVVAPVRCQFATKRVDHSSSLEARWQRASGAEIRQHTLAQCSTASAIVLELDQDVVEFDVQVLAQKLQCRPNTVQNHCTSGNDRMSRAAQTNSADTGSATLRTCAAQSIACFELATRYRLASPGYQRLLACKVGQVCANVLRVRCKEREHKMHNAFGCAGSRANSRKSLSNARDAELVVYSN